MREFQCNDPSVLVAGPVIQTFLSALGPYQGRGVKVVRRIFKLDDVRTDPGTFYSLQHYLSVLDEFQKQFGDGFLQRMGTLIYESIDKASFPETIDSAGPALAWVDTAYQMNHSNATGKIGGYHWTPSADGGTMVCDNPYPCSFDLGVVGTIAKRFAPEAKLTHLHPEACRHRAAESCTYLVEW